MTQDRERGARPFKVSASSVTPKASILTIEGAIDSSNVSKVKQAFEALFAKGVYQVILDLEKVSFIASAGFSSLLSMRDATRRNGGEIIFACASPTVREVFDLLGVTSFLRFAPDLLDAQAQLGQI